MYCRGQEPTTLQTILNSDKSSSDPRAYVVVSLIILSLIQYSAVSETLTIYSVVLHSGAVVEDMIRIKRGGW